MCIMLVRFVRNVPRHSSLLSHVVMCHASSMVCEHAGHLSVSASPMHRILHVVCTAIVWLIRAFRLSRCENSA
jgi:hypothetical protein